MHFFYQQRIDSEFHKQFKYFEAELFLMIGERTALFVAFKTGK